MNQPCLHTPTVKNTWTLVSREKLNMNTLLVALVALSFGIAVQGRHPHALEGRSVAEIEEIRQLHSGTHGPPGSVIGDPHFTGFNGVKFDFQGSIDPKKPLWYSLLSSPTVELNAHLETDFLFTSTTVMREIGFTSTGGDKIDIKVAVGADGRGNVGVTANGAAVSFGSSQTLPGGTVLTVSPKVPGQDVKIDISTSKYTFHLISPNVAGSLVWYDRLDIGSEVYELETAHGILGQTLVWPEKYACIDGVDADYVVSDEFSADFKYTRFGVAESQWVVLPTPTETTPCNYVLPKAEDTHTLAPDSALFADASSGIVSVSGPATAKGPAAAKAPSTAKGPSKGPALAPAPSVAKTTATSKV